MCLNANVTLALAESPDPGYADCDTLLNTGGSAVFNIQKSGVDVNKLVIGKPGGLDDVSEAQQAAAGGGFIDPATLGTCIQQAVSKGWKAGVMSFQVSLPDLLLRARG